MLRKVLLVAIWVACISLPDAVAFFAPPTPTKLAIVQEPAAVNPAPSPLEAFQQQLDDYLTTWF